MTPILYVTLYACFRGDSGIEIYRQNKFHEDDNCSVCVVCLQFNVSSNSSFFDIILNGRRLRHLMQVEALESATQFDDYDRYVSIKRRS